MIAFIKSLYVSILFFVVLILLAFVYLVAYWIKPLFAVNNLFFILFAIFIIGEIIALYKRPSFIAQRVLPEKFSNSDENEVLLKLSNNYNFPIKVEVIDEIPKQFQKRDFLILFKIASKQTKEYHYKLVPKERGEYVFGNLNCYVSAFFGLVKRRYTFNKEQLVKVYPSFIQMQSNAFMAMQHFRNQSGIKKIRRIGHTMEFEKIKEYVIGDDIRSINWKATSKTAKLMVNQYQDERSQPIYNLIDIGRVMKMPFKGLSLLDYAINTSLSISNIILRKKDKVGMLTFSKDIENQISANNKNNQLQLILERLYNIDTKFTDTDFGKLYAHIRRNINQRSLLLLYTNFEHIGALKRQLPYLKGIANSHLLVVIFFENETLMETSQKKSLKIEDIYEQTIATTFVQDKYIMQKELLRYGIQSILTKPEHLSISVINKYLEIKAKGLL